MLSLGVPRGAFRCLSGLVPALACPIIETGLESRLAELHSRVHRGAYRAQPSRRVYIPKPDGRQRPLGVAALEDKVVQRAVVTILNQIYEEDSLGFSYGFRPGRSQHQALDALYVAITRKKVNWILDCDINCDIRSCCAVHSAVGWAVTLKWTIRLRS
jgi:hypothetical protein